MFIKNYHQLATNPLREDALQIITAGLTALQPSHALKETVKFEDPILHIKDTSFDLRDYEHIYVIGIGKASLKVGQYLEELLDWRITDGVIIDIQTDELKHIRTFLGTHPLPSPENIEATDQIIQLLNGVTKKDLVLTIITGGGSSLLCKPNKLTATELQLVVNYLLKSGADIAEMNIIRKHLSLVHGGNLAKFAYPATIASLIFSDIPYSDLSLIASGPTIYDSTTKFEALHVATKYDLPNMPFIETPKTKKYFSRVTNTLVLSNKTALESMAQKAEELGYTASILSNNLRGEADKVGQQLLKVLKKEKSIILAGGETTVKVRGHGKGGRNQELVLASIAHLKKNQLIAAIASDGVDNITDAGGAIADYQTIEKMKKHVLKPDFYLESNDSYNFFTQIGDLLVTNPTGSNVSDLLMVMSQ